MLFQNRTVAGRHLAAKLSHFTAHDNLVVLALPRGGVPVGYEVAEALGAPLDVFVVRKLGTPGHEDQAMGAIASGGVRVLNDGVVRLFQPSEEAIARVEEQERRELERREREYRGGRPPLDVRGKTVILVDDGLATGTTMRAAVAALRRMDPAWVVVAVPVGPVEACQEFEGEADETVCAHEAHPFSTVGEWYEDFPRTTDEEVRALLDRAAKVRARPAV